MTAPASDTLLEFYFMRHARTVANENRLANGGDGIETELAQGADADLQKAASFLTSINDSIGTIYHTEMSRSFESAARVNQDLELPLALSKFFNEQRLGDWEGISWEAAAENYKSGNNPPNGEENQAFLERLQDGLKGLSEAKDDDGKIPLIVSHGGVWLGINKLCGVDTDDWPDNCDIFKARITGDWDDPKLECEQVFHI